MLELLDSETTSAVNTLYSEAVKQEIDYHEHKKTLSYSKRRKLEERSCSEVVPVYTLGRWRRNE